MTSNDVIIQRWLEQDLSDDENISNDECSDVEADVGIEHVIEESGESDSECEETTEVVSNAIAPIEIESSSTLPSEQTSSSEDEGPLSELRSRSRKKNYFGKNRFRWSSARPSLRSRMHQHNIVQEREGIKPAYRSEINASSSPLDIWQHFFTDSMLEKIVHHTNVKIREIRPNYQVSTCVQDLDIVELRAFIGFLFYTAIFKENHEHYTSRYSTDGTGREIYRCIMSKNRFEVLLKTLRFDDSASRPVRRESDASAPIIELFNSFIDQCQAVFAIGSCACIDEMLLAFRGKDSDGLNLPREYQTLKKPTQAVMRLIPPIERSNRNINFDNWYTSIELIDSLKKKQLTGVGTLRKNQKEIPPEFLAARHRNVDSTVFGFTKDIIMSSYVPKKNKAVITVSSMHHMPVVDETTKKPEIILFYNQTKIGVDLLDQRCSNYSTGRRTRRWPLAVFCRMLDISASNCYVVRLSTQPHGQKTETRFLFMKNLAKGLTIPHMDRRANNLKLQRDIRMAIRRILDSNKETTPSAVPTSSSAEERLAVRKNCST
ncbi:PiggyBac transposable element-derived protein 4 [Eumeta japonica]|uniref:PiggyBac transposable element-derived protein 4 n=1 Tax=Eumeta variegata TaxID=151549 RepID=A0A4C1TFS6_EUMVA|nr:PiggyBac transposable element-derived protein 4 [Eumeta japonica]